MKLRRSRGSRWLMVLGACAPAFLCGPAHAQAQSGRGALKVHVISTRNTYQPMAYDLFNAATGQLVGTGKGADESMGEQVQVWDLDAGTYKIVEHGNPFAAKSDFATASVDPGRTNEFLIVVDPDTLQFRGSGPVAGELPKGTRLVGLRIAATVGGSLMLNEKEQVVGSTSGLTSVWALFGNFSLVLDKGNHFLSVVSEQQLGLTSQPTSSLQRNSDRWETSALYAYNLNNKYVGPYARSSFRTQLFPGYLYLKNEQGSTVAVTTHFKNGMVTTTVYPMFASPDSLRVRIADPFTPFILQEELGANLKAIDLDLYLVKLSVSTRLGWAFRNGLLSSLKVVQGNDKGPTVQLYERDDYFTTGPIIGAGATVTFARWLYGASQFGMIFPVKDTEVASFGVLLLIDLAGTAGLRLPAFTSFLFGSFDYTFRVTRDAYITNDTQFDQTLMARLN